MDAIEGGRHPEWGTANWIVPLGDAYLEFVGIVDEQEAKARDFGHWVARAVERGGGPLGWAVRPSDLDSTARRLSLDIRSGSRTKPSGEILAWRFAGVSAAARRPWLPFFIDWPETSTFPGQTPDPNAAIARLEIAGDAGELAAWLGPHQLPLDVRAGDAGLTAVVLEGPHGRVTLRREAGG